MTGLERKDIIPITIALLALAVTLGGFVNKPLAVLLLIVAGLLLIFYYLTRESDARARITRDPSEADFIEARRRNAIADLKRIYDATHSLYLSFVVASDDEQIAAAGVEYDKWLDESKAVVGRIFGEGESEAFSVIGSLPSVSIIVDRPDKSPYRWEAKQRWMQRIDVYRKRLTHLMKLSDSLGAERIL